MSLSLAVALLALLVALFALTALVAVYARVKALEAGRGTDLSGYAALVGRPAPAAVAPRAGERVAIVAVLDTSCASCLTLWATVNEVAAELAGTETAARYVGLVDRSTDLAGAATGPHAELLADVTVRADLFEGYAPTLLAVDASGTVSHRSFVYPDTDVRALLLDLVKGPRS
ncbi:hypothetical protein EV383_1712 [Pseudonocardia sediminis]|uniref:Thioredoxin domain-containing protein n=1 Tax=Pseudonocardia sediminis TaxID=1397368 RepID=A0A4Q7UT43_PSEST|nr:hypothetical protein [Pseudonocardia sediminis]RZT84856.1 hypothetical protein EV383_1712 [Pseudonocardia sediminis]